MLWYSHVTSMGSYWAVVYGLRSMVDQEKLVHGPQTGLRWTESTTLSSGMVYEHLVHARVAGEGGVPLFLPQRARCEPPWQGWCPIGEGKGFLRPRRS